MFRACGIGTCADFVHLRGILAARPVATSPGYALEVPYPLCDSEPPRSAASMPSLLRFLTAIAIIFGICYGVLWALATFVNPKQREITVTVPPDKFVKQPR